MSNLFIVATPIGNLQDITFRAVDTLKTVDTIICEDTRKTNILLHHYGIRKPLVVLNDFNEASVTPAILESITNGKTCALVSDSGTPLISDPGYKLVKSAIERGIAVTSIPGPSAVVTALTISGLPPDKFLFLGFLPKSSTKRKKILSTLKDTLLQMESFKITPTTLFYESPHRIIETLMDLKEIFGDMPIVLAKELTKIHESVSSASISEHISRLEKQTKGEFVILFHFPS